MEQKKYMSITRLGHKSTVGVLNEGDNIIIQEKIDGANASFTIDDNTLKSFSRNRELAEDNRLGGFYDFVHIENADLFINNLNEDYLYFGEWTNPHKVQYEGFAKQFFLFDVYSKSQEKYLEFDIVKLEAQRLGLNLVPIFYEGVYQGFEHLEQYIGKTNLNGKLGDLVCGEGIVVKNVDYVDRFGNQLFVKLVVDAFREVQKQKKAKNPTGFSTSPEYLFAESVATYPRVEKIIHKLYDEGVVPTLLEPKHFGTIFKECNNRTWEDILKEESEGITETMEHKDLRKAISNFATKHAKQYLMNVGVM